MINPIKVTSLAQLKSLWGTKHFCIVNGFKNGPSHSIAPTQFEGRFVHSKDDSEADGKGLNLLTQIGSWTNMNQPNVRLKIRYYTDENKGFALAMERSEWQVVCTSRSNYTNNDDYLKAGFPLWFWVWMNNGNAFWNFCETGSSDNGFWIQNTLSKKYWGFDDTGRGTIMQVDDKDKMEFTIWAVD